MAVLPEMNQAQRHRLAATMELIESCKLMGEKLDPETAMDVLTAAEAELEQQAERAARNAPGGKLPPATPEDIRDLLALISAARILWDVATCLQMRKQPGRQLRLILKARDLVLQEVVAPILMAMPTGERTPTIDRAMDWQYQLWGPEHVDLVRQVLESTISGKPAKKQVKEAAEYLLSRFIPTPDLDRMQQKSAAAEG